MLCLIYFYGKQNGVMSHDKTSLQTLCDLGSLRHYSSHYDVIYLVMVKNITANAAA